MKPILIITGPTASGKSKLAVELAQELGTEIISADSMQIYKRMNIGTAKPTLLEQCGVKHHLIDIVEPDSQFSSYLFKEKTEQVLKSFEQKNLIPLIVGGTGFYLKNLLYRFDFEQAENPGIRQVLQRKLEKDGNDALYAELCLVDKESASVLHPNDSKRVMRALEIFYECGIKKSQGQNDTEPKYPHLIFVLNLERKMLYERINGRVDEMMDKGLLQEVNNLIESGIQAESQSMQAIGYKELSAHIEGNFPLQTAVDLIKQHTRNYAKRQITYFKKLENAIWLDASSPIDDIKNEIKTQYSEKFMIY